MKTMILILSILLSFTSCKDGNRKIQQKNKIVGNWRLKQVYHSDGGSSPSWQNVTNGYTLTIYSNGNFNSNKFQDCEAGNYTTNTNNEITFNYSCPSFRNSYKEKIEELSESQLILKPTYMDCDEGCSYKFVKE